MSRLSHKHNAFSLFEAVVSIVILGIVGIICSSMLLQISKNVAYTKNTSDSSPHLALLKIQNLLEYAIIESLSANGTPFTTPSSQISFSSIEYSLFFDGGAKNTTKEVQNDTLLPNVSLVVDSHHANTLYFTSLKGWQSAQEAYIPSNPKEAFKPYTITRIQGNAIVLERAPTHTPRIILPIKTHNLAFHSNALWLDNALLLDDVLSFLITPIVSAQGTFLALELCVKSPTKARCENGGVWLDDIVRILL